MKYRWNLTSSGQLIEFGGFPVESSLTCLKGNNLYEGCQKEGNAQAYKSLKQVIGKGCARGLLSKARYIRLPFGFLRSGNWDIFKFIRMSLVSPVLLVLPYFLRRTFCILLAVNVHKDV